MTRMTLCIALKMLAVFSTKVTQEIHPQQLMGMKGIWGSQLFVFNGLIFVPLMALIQMCIYSHMHAYILVSVRVSVCVWVALICTCIWMPEVDGSRYLAQVLTAYMF